MDEFSKYRDQSTRPEFTITIYGLEQGTGILRDRLTPRTRKICNILYVYGQRIFDYEFHDVTTILHSHHSEACRSIAVPNVIIMATLRGMYHPVEKSGTRWQSFPSRHKVIIQSINKGTKVRRESRVDVCVDKRHIYFSCRAVLVFRIPFLIVSTLSPLSSLLFSFEFTFVNYFFFLFCLQFICTICFSLVPSFFSPFLSLYIC